MDPYHSSVRYGPYHSSDSDATIASSDSALVEGARDSALVDRQVTAKLPITKRVTAMLPLA